MLRGDFPFLRRIIYSCIVIFPLFATSHLRAQQEKIDSLKTLIGNHNGEDTLRVNAMVQLTRYLYWSGQYEEALQYAHGARKLSKKLGFYKGEGNSWIASGHTYLRRGQYDSALRHFGQARSSFTAITNYRSLANSHVFTGQAYDYLAEYDKALEHYRIALGYIESYPDDAIMFKILNSTGVTHFKKGSYEMALEYYLKSLKICEKLNDKLYYASTLNNIGVVHMSILQYGEALKYFLLYLKTMKELQHTQSIAVAMLNVGEAHMNLRHYTDAVHYLDSALVIYRQIDEKRGQSLTHSNLGDSYRNLHDYANAGKHYDEAIHIAEDIKSDEALVKALIGATELYLKTGDTKKAAVHLERAQATAKRIGSMLELEKAYLYNSKLDSARGNYREAYQWFKKYSALNDSLFNESKSRQVLQMRELYESEKKDKEIILLSEAKKLEELKLSGNRKLLWVSVIFFVTIIICILYWVYVKSRHSTVLKDQNEKISDANRELKKLVDKVEDQNKMLAQKNETLEDLHREKDGLIGVVAHDLRSPLNRIAGLTQILAFNNNLSGEEKEIIDIIQKVCKDGNGLIRDLLDINQYENSEALNVTTVALTHYVSALLGHYTHHLDKKDLKMFFEYETEASIVTDASYLDRILDNIITNAIKFSPAGRNIYVRILKQRDTVKIVIQDEGQGFHPDDLPHLFRKFKKLSARPTAGESSTGLGLSIVKSLVEKIRGSIRVDSAWGKGATFVIELPLDIVQERAAV
jgi:signal transduction histidine kinase/Tfp pilus assembly protein PilF